MTRGSTLAPRLITSFSDDNSIASSPVMKRSIRHLKPAKKEHTRHRTASESESSSNISNWQTSYRTTQQHLRKVSFADEFVVKTIQRIPKAYANDIWYAANEFDNFRTKVLNCKELRLKMKLKSARCRNHMRRVLLEYRINLDLERKEKKTTTRCDVTRNSLNLSSLSMRCSKKSKEVAIKNAKKLEKEIIADQMLLNPTISNCFGPSHRWVIEYYFGYFIDTLCTAI
jgi:hypothetical protein